MVEYDQVLQNQVNQELEEKFLFLIRDYPCIYNKTLKDHQQGATERAMEEIAHTLHEDGMYMHILNYLFYIRKVINLLHLETQSQ